MLDLDPQFEMRQWYRQQAR